MKFLLITLAILFTTQQSQAGWRIRAREHYEIHNIEHNNSIAAEYRGFSNTINVWYEKPLEWSFGFAGGPVLGTAKKIQDNLLGELGDTIQLFSVGLEFKYFLMKSLPGLYTRLGTGWNHLKTKGLIETSVGWHIYTGLGWELPLKYFSIVPEIAMRNTYLNNRIIIISFTPSIGLHFHNLF